MSSGIGRAVKSRRQGFAIQRAQCAERPTRALSVAMPVLAYICRYNLEISTNASRDFRDSTQCARALDPISKIPEFKICAVRVSKAPAPYGDIAALKPRCIGCSNCVLACPFGVPNYDGAAEQMMKCDMCYDRTSTGRRPMCATVCPSGALAFTTIEEIMRTRQGRAINDWQFGDQHVRTKVFVLVPTEVTHVNVAVIPLSSLRRSQPPADPYDVAALLEAQ